MVSTAPVRTDLWQVLAGRAVGTPLAPDDPGLWDRIATRLDVAKARPRLREGIEAVAHVTVRGQPYVMLRSPDRLASYVRLAPDEWALAQEMDGTRSVAVLVGSFARRTGTLAPDRVTRVVADLGASRMLEELPVDAFRGLNGVRRSGSARSRLRRRLLDAARGRRMVLGDVDALMGLLYRAGGRLLFTTPAAVVAALLAVTGLVLFLRAWVSGSSSLFLASGSYATGGLVLLGLNLCALLAHELGHALATKHAGRRVPAVGVLLYFGIPSAFVDTTDIWMASRKHRLIATAAGPASALTLAGVAQLAAAFQPELAPLAFKLSFAWYLNALFNLNPLMALDGYYLAMDALEIANLRARGIRFVVGLVRGRRATWRGLDRETRYVAAYGVATVLWTVTFACLSLRLWRDRLSGLVAGLWHTGAGGRLLVVGFVAGLFAPVVWGLSAALWRRVDRERLGRADRGPRGVARRLDVLRSSRLGTLPPAVLDALAGASAMLTVPAGGTVLAPGAVPPSAFVVGSGSLAARRPGDPAATVRVRAGAGDVAGVAEVTADRPAALEWRAESGARLVAIPAGTFREAAAEHLAPPGVDVHAAEAALDASPALAGLSPSSRVTLLATMRPLDVPPGKRLTVAGPENAVLIGAGVLADDSGAERRAGDVLQAAVADHPVRATTRTRATLWRLPGIAGIGAVAGAGGGAGLAAAGAPVTGAHGDGGHPPVVPPPTPVPGGDDDADDRLWRRVRRLLVLLLVVALLALAALLADATPWAEVRGDRVLFGVVDGHADAVVDGRSLHLREGGRVTLGRGDRVEIGRRSTGELVYAGGARQVLCGGSRATVVSVRVADDDGDRAPAGVLTLDRGALLADTRQQSDAFAPLDLRVEAGALQVHAAGPPARFGVTPYRLDVAAGEVTVDGGVASPAGSVDCRGLAVPATSDGSPSPAPTASGSAAPPPPSGSPTPAGSPVPVPTAGPTLTTAPSPTGSPPPSPLPTAPPPPVPTRTSAAPTRSPAAPADLKWTCDPTTLTSKPGGTSRTTCTVTASGSFAGDVTFSCENAPDGVGCTPSTRTATLARDGSASLTYAITVGSRVPPGSYQLRAVVTSGDGSIVRKVTVVLVVE